MTGILPKRPRLRLEPNSYKELCRRVMERDTWRCQVCGSGQNLQVHHQQLRSQQGPDEDSNLITLCAKCHEARHSGYGQNPESE
jgi:5-methylcytosine-specific restriction endonuclease McrA